MTAWIEGRVAGTRRWTDSLCSLRVEAPALTFTAGQFARLALPAPAGAKDSMIGRPYSFVNPPAASPHEFYFIILPEGPLSPRLAELAAGDSVWLAPRGSGFFCIAETAEAPALWCLSTGTGIGPFLSILRSEDAWKKFGRVVLVHAVRYASELTYQGELEEVSRTHPGAFDYVQMVSREAHPGALAGRIPAAIEDGRLEARVGLRLDRESAHAMLCGNPAMVDDVQKVLGLRGMQRHRRREPGHITLETYW